MHLSFSNRYCQSLLSCVLAVVVVGGLFLWQGHYGLNLADEGFLWYGAQRVQQGDIPIRDFMAYDPGRYYWSALWMNWEGSHGIMALRRSIAISQALGLAVAVTLVARMLPRSESSKARTLFLAIAALVLGLWMFPFYKIADTTLSILLVAALAFLVQRPTYYRYFFTGIVVGLVAVFGRNHGVYGLAAGFGVTVYLALTRRSWVHFSKACLASSIGVMNGFLPVLFMLTLVEGFAPAFVESVRFILFELKSTNLPLPVPWPWRVPVAELSRFDALVKVLVGCFFLAVALYGAFAIVGVLWRGWVQRKPVAPLTIATAFTALPYAHYAFSRADFEHLALGVFPLLIFCFAVLARQNGWVKWVCVSVFAMASLVTTVPHHIGWLLGPQCRSGQCTDIEVVGDRLTLHQATATEVRLLQSLADEFSPNGRAMIATPFWPGAYAVLERKSPMWSIYALFPRSETFQKAEIERIKAADPGFALVMDMPLDGREELRFSQTNPLIYQHIQKTLTPITDQAPGSPYQLFRHP